jgi:metallo-beta-lactamase family protein
VAASVNITFLGAAREVTGSCYLVRYRGRAFLVDCGMFQGGADAYRRNRTRFAFDPKAIEFVLLTHAHIDHSGLLPRLVQAGFRGPIYATPATCDLLEVMLPDAAYLQEREAERNSGKRAARPLYTLADARAALGLTQPIAYDREVSPGAEVLVRFRDAGHILGSAILELWMGADGRRLKVVFSGDLGQPVRPVVADPMPIAEADVLLVESTYGNRLHRSLQQTEDELVAVITRTLGSGRGNVVIPAFAVGRTQELLHLLVKLVKEQRIATPLAIYVDSPMATRATEVTLRHRNIVDAETRDLIGWGIEAGGKMLQVHFTESLEESKRLNTVRHGAIIISASGMCDAGRIRHHLKHNLPRPECAIVFSGFQAIGTLGRRLVDGDKRVRLFGEEIDVRASIHTIGGLSAHADRAGLLGWLQGFTRAPARTFVVHGEAATAIGFAEYVRKALGWQVEAPAPGAQFELEAASH